MATATTPKKRSTAKRTTKPRTAAARSTSARKGATTRGVNKTKAAAKNVKTDAKTIRTDTATTADAATSAGRSAVLLAGNYAERVAYVQVGAVLTARDSATATIVDLRARVADRDSAEKELKKLEKRGEVARVRATREVKKARTRVERELRQRRNRVTRDVKRNRTRVEREVRSLRKDARQQIKDVRAQVLENIQFPQVQVPQVPDVVTPVREAVKPVVERFAA
jgi:hypothetical protein